MIFKVIFRGVQTRDVLCQKGCFYILIMALKGLELKVSMFLSHFMISDSILRAIQHYVILRNESLVSGSLSCISPWFPQSLWDRILCHKGA